MNHRKEQSLPHRECGHSACGQNFIDTGDTRCLYPQVPPKWAGLAYVALVIHFHDPGRRERFMAELRDPKAIPAITLDCYICDLMDEAARRLDFPEFESIPTTHPVHTFLWRELVDREELITDADVDTTGTCVRELRPRGWIAPGS